MAFAHTNSKGQEYFLHQQDVTLKGGRTQRIYFFARALKEDGKAQQVEALPEGYTVKENPRTGLPILKKAV